jgi:uncharacterized membrane protein
MPFVQWSDTVQRTHARTSLQHTFDVSDLPVQVLHGATCKKFGRNREHMLGSGSLTQADVCASQSRHKNRLLFTVIASQGDLPILSAIQRVVKDWDLTKPCRHKQPIKMEPHWRCRRPVDRRRLWMFLLLLIVSSYYGVTVTPTTEAFAMDSVPFKTVGAPLSTKLAVRSITRFRGKGSSLRPLISKLQRPQSRSLSTTTLAVSLLPTAAWRTLLSSTQATLHGDASYCLAAILWTSTFGLTLERRTIIGKALSAPLATMALALVLANVGVIPFASPIYEAVNRYAVSLAVPMLLYDSDLRRVVADTGSLLAAFGVGAMATVIGTLVAFPLLPMRSLGKSQAYKVASALAARHIGGAINFVAVAETLSIPGTVVSAAIAADNVVVALYFAFLFALAKADDDDDAQKDDPAGASRVVVAQSIDTELDYSLEPAVNGDDVASPAAISNEITLPTISMALAVASALVAVGKMLTSILFPGSSSLPLTSTLTVVAATVFPRFFARIRTAGTAIGILCIQMFFAASGAAGSIALVLSQAPSLFAFSALQIAVHFGVLLALGRGILRLNLNELYLSSNANVGGPTTAAAMAQAKNWKRLVLPALLVGILGYATATGIALALAPILQRLPILGGPY